MQQNNQDAVLLDLLKDGSAQAFTTVYHKYHHMLMVMACDMLKDVNKAEDLLQEFFMDFWHKKLFLKIDINYQNRDKDSIMKNYLYASIRNRCLNKITREKKFISDIPDEPFLPNDPLESKEIYTQVNSALKKKVPPKSSAAFRLRHYEQKSHKEIAAEMNTSIQTVKNQIGTAVKILRGYFSPAHL
ncbi:sigma-70 family RNA polymerase sigma factor [Chitinophaga polysaccharea]|uniref:RNA polymerase sigma factor n=1 Tax=Chitinophaga TaxID=79328 RepID=UPI001455C8DF|nr:MULTISPECIES: sigma-70 family RNA polymerase sigma factor [Chitinophaga]NLR60955.1 sigma-70 family RNA polymerase sigma factor [Chitinophaga polysaccharea]NLU94671.1 sigma-70 family RNA polymerase sigma factor [Chitinophaga sp. Ak27]